MTREIGKPRCDAEGEWNYALSLLRQAITRLDLSARAYHRVLKLARSVADLAGAGAVGSAHVAEAIQYRRVDRALAPA